MNSYKLIRVVFCLLIVASLVWAPQALAGDFYIGAALNRSYVDEQIDLDGFDVRLDGDASGVRLALGYEFNDYFAAEIAHTDFGELNQSALGLSLSAEADAQELAVLGRLPLGERFTAFGRLGYAWWDAETAVEAAVADESGKDVSIGAGLEFSVGETLSVALTGTRYRIDELDVSVLGLGVRFRF